MKYTACVSMQYAITNHYIAYCTIYRTMSSWDLKLCKVRFRHNAQLLVITNTHCTLYHHLRGQDACKDLAAFIYTVRVGNTPSTMDQLRGR